MAPRHGSPLSGVRKDASQPLWQGAVGVAQLREIPDVRLASLRLDPTDPALAGTIRGVLGLDLPQAPGTVMEIHGLAALWLGPREWLLRGDSTGVADLVAKVESALSGQFFAVSEQSDAFAVMRLRGPKAREVLNAGCPLDLHPRVFMRNRCAQSHFFKASVLLWALADDGVAWEVIVRRSFSDYVARMLVDAMAGVA